MTTQGAEKAITTSALMVAGVYIYRRLTEGSGTATGTKTAQLLGQGSPPSVGTFITAWGAAYLIMAIMATASPGLGGGFAILAATGDLLSNGQQIFADINTKLSATKTSPGAALATQRLTHPPTTLNWNIAGPVPAAAP